MNGLTYEQKRKIGMKLYNFLYCFTSEGYRKFDTKYPDYDTFKESVNLKSTAPVKYMQKIIEDGAK